MSAISERPIPEGATVFTNTLAGSTLDELLQHAATSWWPDSTCTAEWDLLRNWAMQEECQRVDIAESDAWRAAMRALADERLPYADWVTQRCVQLAERAKSRKRAQWRLRDKYGYARKRSWRLISRDIRAFHALWSTTQP